MSELLKNIESFISKEQRFAVATVIKTWGSAPRPVGSVMLIAEDGSMSGSVSGGCVEGAVVKHAMIVLENNKPQILDFGVTDDEAWLVGLSCGGSISIFIEPFLSFTDAEMWKILRGCLEKDEGCVLMTKLNQAVNEHILVLPHDIILNKKDSLETNALRAYNERKSQIIETLDDNSTWFLNVMPPKNRLIIIGAAHITVDLVHLAHYFGFDTTVIDPRGIFATKTDFPTPPKNLFIDWPADILPDLNIDNYTYSVLLTHDPKIDDQALHILLKSGVAYIGCLGSKKTHEKRVKRLIDVGFDEKDIAKIHAPIGMDIHAKTAREIALSIMGELIKIKNAFL